MFMGEYNHTVDAKGRLIVPSKFREQLGDEFVITKGLDNCLFVYDNSEWAALEEKLRALPITNTAGRKFSRFLLGSAATCEVDKQGRILLPSVLREFAGTGISGIAAAKLVLERGGEVVLYDGYTALNTDEIRAKFGKDAKVGIVLGEIKRSDLLGVELCIISPGIPLNSGFVAVVDEAGIPVLGEIELAYQCGLGKLAAITGTNGKTTTTALTGAILRSQYEETFVVGNIGEPYTSKVSEMTDQSVTVAEVSSFQLETIMDFHPDVSAILNITPDHLDRHGSMENYIRIKECITMNQTAKDAVVLNYDDPVLREFGESRIEEPEPAEDAADTETEAVAREDGLDGAEDLREPDETAGEEPEQSETEVTETVSESEAEETDPEEVLSGLKARVFWFSSRERLKEGFFLDGDNIVYADGTKEQILVNVKELQLLGRHNYENVMAAAYIGLFHHFFQPFFTEISAEFFYYLIQFFTESI